MNCRQTQRHSSAYLDGELDFETSAGVRGHLRVCPACAQLIADERSLIEAATELDAQIEPPPELWKQIGEELARREIEDGRGSPTVLRARHLWSQTGACLRTYWAHGVISVALVAGLLMLVTKPDRQPDVGGVVVSDTAGDTVSHVADGERQTYVDAVSAEIRSADKRYLIAIRDLRETAIAESSDWSESSRKHFEQSVRDFELRAQKLRKQISRGAEAHFNPRLRDPLYKLYRQHIIYLEGAVFGQLSAVAGEP